MKKLNILFVNPFYKPYIGGIEKTIENLTDGLKEKNEINKIGLLTSFNNHPAGKFEGLPSKETSNNITIYRLNFIPRGIKLNLGLGNGGYFALGIKKVLDDFKPDIIHFMNDNWYVPNLIIYLHSRKSSKHLYSVIYHDINRKFRYKYFYVPKILINSFLTKHVNSVPVITTIEQEKVKNMYKTPIDKFKIIPLGVTIKKNVNRDKSEDKVIKILSVGRLESGKGQYKLIKLYKKLLDRTSVKTKLILAGPNGGDRPKIEEYIRKNNLTEKIHITGYLSDEDLNAQYENSNIFVLLSNYEAFGLVYLEALAHKIPIVTYKIAAIPEVLKKGAFLINKNDNELVLSKILELVENDKLRVKMGNEGYTYVMDNYSWSKTTDAFLELYKKIAK